MSHDEERFSRTSVGIITPISRANALLDHVSYTAPAAY